MLVNEEALPDEELTTRNSVQLRAALDLLKVCTIKIEATKPHKSSCPTETIEGSLPMHQRLQKARW